LASIFRKDGRRKSVEAACLVQVHRKKEEQVISPSVVYNGENIAYLLTNKMLENLSLEHVQAVDETLLHHYKYHLANSFENNTLIPVCIIYFDAMKQCKTVYEYNLLHKEIPLLIHTYFSIKEVWVTSDHKWTFSCIP
jgi:hypothetical protein